MEIRHKHYLSFETILPFRSVCISAISWKSHYCKYFIQVRVNISYVYPWYWIKLIRGMILCSSSCIIIHMLVMMEQTDALLIIHDYALGFNLMNQIFEPWTSLGDNHCMEQGYKTEVSSVHENIRCSVNQSLVKW